MIHSRRHRPAWRSHKRFPIPQLWSKSILIRSENRTYPRDFQQQHAAEYLVTFLCDVELRREHQPFFHKISSVFAALKAAVAVGGDPERVCAPFEIMFHQSKSWSEHFLLSGKQGFLIKWPRGVGGSWDSARIFNIWLTKQLCRYNTDPEENLRGGGPSSWHCGSSPFSNFYTCTIFQCPFVPSE